jgi:pseudouridine kinase
LTSRPEEPATEAGGDLETDDPFVVVVGGANVDIEGRPQSQPVLHESNPGTVTISAGGVGRNIAADLAVSGLRTLLMTAFGDDDHGRFLRAETAAAGVDLGSALWVAGMPTATYVSILDASGDLFVAISDMAVLDQIGREFLTDSRDALSRAQVVVADCNLSDEALDELTSSAATVFVDTVSAAKAARLRPYLSRVHTVKPNRAEAGALTGLEVHDRVTGQRAIEWLLARGVKAVFLTLGSEGALWADDTGESGSVPAAPRGLMSTTGAGDAFTAALVIGYCEARPISEVAEHAARAAAIATDSRRSSRDVG